MMSRNSSTRINLKQEFELQIENDWGLHMRPSCELHYICSEKRVRLFMRKVAIHPQSAPGKQDFEEMVHPLHLSGLGALTKDLLQFQLIGFSSEDAARLIKRFYLFDPKQRTKDYSTISAV